MKTRLVLAVVSLLLGASLVGCGGKDKPAVCDSVDTLKGSITDLTDIKLTSSGAVSSLQAQLTSIKQDYDAVRTDAKSHFTTPPRAAGWASSALPTSAATASSS